MRNWIVIVLVCAVFSIQSWAAEEPSSEQKTNREVVRTYVKYYLRHQEYGEAIRALTEHVVFDAKDAGAWHLLGQAYMGSGENKRAIQTIGEALKYASEDTRGIFLYAYADALNRAGDSEKARATLLEAGQIVQVSESAGAALAVLKSGVALPSLKLAKPSLWKTNLGVGMGYDSNVLLNSDAVMATIKRSDTASPVLNVTGQVSNERPLHQGVFASRLVGGINGYSASAAQKYNALFASLGFDWAREPEADRVSFKLGNGFDINWLNSSGYKFFSWTDTIKPRVIYPHSKGGETEIELPIYYQRFTLDPGDLAANNRSGPGGRVGISHRRAFGSGLLSSGLRFERHFAQGANYRANTYAVPLSWSQPLVWGLAGSLVFEGAQVSYSESAPSRTDRSARFSLSLGRRFAQSVFGAIDVAAMRNTSTVMTARYTKLTAMLRVSYEF